MVIRFADPREDRNVPGNYEDYEDVPIRRKADPSEKKNEKKLPEPNDN